LTSSPEEEVKDQLNLLEEEKTLTNPLVGLSSWCAESMGDSDRGPISAFFNHREEGHGFSRIPRLIDRKRRGKN
jgi:hypothetical protein